MNKKEFVAMMVFAISRDMMNYTFQEVWYKLCTYIGECCEYYDITPDDVIDDIIEDAQKEIKMGYSYGKYDKQIMSIAV